MSRSKKALNGFAADIFGQIISQILSFIAIPIYLIYLSNVSYGYWLTIGSIIMWISLSDFGIGMALSRLLINVQSTKTNQNLIEERNKLITTALVIFTICALIFFSVGLCLYPFCVNWFKVSVSEIHIFRNTYFICITAGALSLPSSLFPGILESNQKLALNRNLSTISAISNVLVSVLLIYWLQNISALAYALLFSVLIKALISYGFIIKTISINFKLYFFDSKYAKQLLSSGGYFQISRIANTVATNSDNLFISSYISSGVVPMYSFTTKMAQLFGITLASKIPNVLFAGMSEIIDLQQLEKLKTIFNLLLKILTRLALLTAAYAYFFNNDFVNLWVGKQNYAGYGVNLVVCYWIIYEFIVRGTSSLAYAFGDFKGYAFASIFEIIGNIVLSIILIQKYGLLGVALATAISRTFTTGIYLVWYFNSKQLLSIKLLKIVMKVILCSVPTLLSFLFIKNLNLNIGWTQLVLIGLFGAFINFITFDLIVIIKNRHLGLKEIINKIIFNL